MMFINKHTAAQMEACIKQTHIEMTQQYPNGRILEISGGAACFIDSDSFFSQVIGWGFATKPKQFKAEIETIERFYQSLNHPRVDIELCPFVGNDLAVFLSQRGYGMTEFNNVSALNLDDYDSVSLQADNFIIKEVSIEEIPLWAGRVAAGFGYPEAQDQFTHYTQAKGVSTFAVFHQDTIVAGATLAIHGVVCDLGVTSVLPAYRGRGLHKQLLLTRLNVAKMRGLAMATVTTAPGSISDFNIQKVGFRCGYTRIKMTLGI